MIGHFEIYDIDKDGNRVLILKRKNMFIPGSWEPVLTGEQGTVDIKLFSDFGRGRDLRIVLSEWRIVRAYDRDIDNLQSEIDASNLEIDAVTTRRDEAQKELDTTLQEISDTKKLIVDSEQGIEDAKAAINRLKVEIPAAKRDVQFKEDEITRLIKQKELLENDIRTYNRELETLTDTIKGLEIDIDSIKNQIERRSDQLSSNADILSIKTRIRTYTDANTKNSSDITDLEAEKVIYQKEFESLRDVWIQKDTDNAPDASVAKQEMQDKQNQIASIDAEIRNLKGDIEKNKGFIANLRNQLIEKTIELDPSLKTLQDRLVAKEKELKESGTTKTEFEDKIKTTNESIRASSENTENARSELVTLKEIVTNKENSVTENTNKVVTLQVDIVSATNTIGVKELEVPEKEKVVGIINEELAEIEAEKQKKQDRIVEIRTIRDAREANINNVSIVDYRPFEFRNDDEKLEYPTLRDWHAQNLTDEEISEIGDKAIKSKHIIGTIPSYLDITFEDDSKLYGLWYGSASEMNQAQLGYVFPAETGNVLPSFIGSSKSGIVRHYPGQKLTDETSEIIYKKSYHIGKYLTTPGTYTYIGVTYGQKEWLLSVANVVRDDDVAKSIIINEGHTLEINYVYDFFIRPYKDFEYKFTVNNTEYKASIEYDKNIPEEVYMNQVNHLKDTVCHAATNTRFVITEPGQTDIITHSNHDTGSGGLTHGTVNIRHLVLTHDFNLHRGVRLEGLEFKEFSTDMTYFDGVNGYSKTPWFKMTLDKPLPFYKQKIKIPVPLIKSLFEMQFLRFEEYRGRESDFIKQSGAVGSLIKLDNFLDVHEYADIKTANFPHINNVTKMGIDNGD